MREPTGTVSATGGYEDDAGHWHPEGCRCDACLDDAYVPDPHPNRWDKATNTIWAWSEDAQAYIDTKREPSVMERWTYELTPITTGFLSSFPKTVTMGDPGPQIKAEWGWRHAKD